MTAPGYKITRVGGLDPVACPCGETRRAFVEQPEQTASLHLVEVSEAARTHYHKRLTEIYYILEGEGQVSYRPHRGYLVSEFDHKDLEEIYLIRELLEAEAVREVVTKN